MTIFATPPLHVTTVHADANHFGGRRQYAQYICMHATGGTFSLPWLTTTSPLSNPVSVHRLIDKVGKISKLVNDDEQAWHAGYGVIGPIGPNAATNFNVVSLGIELENMDDGVDTYPPAQLEAAAAQVVEWWGVYGYLPVVAHAQVDTRKTDPAGFPWDDFNVRLTRYLAKVLNAVSAQSTLSPDVIAKLKAADAALDPLIGEPS